MAKTEKAMFGAGCFWGVQYYFDQVPGVVETEVGYTGGDTENPTYTEVCRHGTGHAEAIQIVFDPAEVRYKTLLRHFFRLHDPTQLNRQGPDVGDQYRSVIFYHDDGQLQTARELIEELNKKQYDGKIVTTLEPAAPFWPAERAHQKFTQRTGAGFCHVAYSPLPEEAKG